MSELTLLLLRIGFLVLLWAFVFAVIRSMIASAWIVKPSACVVGTTTGVAPASFTCSGIVGQ